MASKYRVDVEVRTLTQKFTQGFDKIDRRLNNAGRNFKKFAAFASGAIAGIGFGALIKRTINFGDELNKLEDKLGTTVEGMSQLSFVADQTGVAFTQLSTGLQRASRRISEAASGTGEAKNALKELGVDAQKLNQISPDKQLIVLADAFQRVEGQSDKLRLAFKLFDTEGVKLLQTMKGGSEKMNRLASEADALGKTLSKEAAQAMTEAKDEMNKLKSSSEALAQVFARELAPAITAFAGFAATAIPKALIHARKVMVGFLEFSTRGISDFLLVLGKIPGSFGEPFRNAGAAVQDFSNIMSDMRTQYVADLEKIDKEGKGLGKSFAEGLDTSSFLVARQSLDQIKESAKKAAKSVDKLTEAEKAHNKLMAEGIRLTESLRTPLEVYEDGLFDVNEMLQETAISNTTFNRQLKELKDEFDGVGKKAKQTTQEISVFAKRAAENMQDSLATFFKSAGKGTDDFKESFLNAIRDIAAELAASKIFNLIGQSSSSGSVAGLIGSAFAGFFAGGGDIRAGQFGVVGENGPELFAPKTSGTIIPNAVGGNTYNIDARGAQRGVSQEIMQALQQTEERSVSRSTAAIHKEIDGGGPLAKKIGLRA